MRNVLASELDEATEQLNEAIEAFESMLQERGFSCTGHVEMVAGRGDLDQLWWGRIGDAWCLFVVKDGIKTPLLSTSRATRVLAAGKLKDLYAVLETARVDMLLDVKTAKLQLQKFTAGLGYGYAPDSVAPGEDDK